MDRDTDVIVIDNTNLVTEHYMWYVNKARSWGYEPVVVEFHTNWHPETYIRVVQRSRRNLNVERYDPEGRMWAFESHDDAIVMRIQGLQANAADAAREYETHLRGYGYRR